MSPRRSKGIAVYVKFPIPHPMSPLKLKKSPKITFSLISPYSHKISFLPPPYIFALISPSSLFYTSPLSLVGADLFIEQLLALAECRLFKVNFRAWQKYCILSLLSPGTFSEGRLINISSKKNAFVRVLTLTIRHFETGLFKKSGKFR